jgi:hypothetical protein
MITIDASFWASVGVDSSDGNANGNQKDFYNSMVVNGVAVNNQYDFFQNSTVNGIVYYNQFDWYRAIGTFYSEPIYDQYSFYQNVTFDGVNAVGNQKDFFEFILGIRYFTTLQSASSQYYTIPTVSLTADFEIELNFSTTSTNTIAFLGNTANNDFLVSLNGTSLRYDLDGSTVQSIPATFNDGKFHNLRVKRVGGVNTIYLDNVLIGTIALPVVTWTIDFIGTRIGGVQLFDGVISDVKITDGTDLIRYYKIDEDLSATSTIIDSGSDGSNGTAISITSSELFTLEGADWIGAELVVNGDFATDTDWTKGTGVTISGGQAHFATSTGAGLYLPNPIDTFLSGLTYKLSLEVSSYVSGTANLEIMNQAEDDFIITSSNGTKTGIKTVQTASVFRPLFRTTAWVADVDNVSVKRILQAP